MTTGCPARQECLEFALDAEEELLGWWGGTTEQEPRWLQRAST